MAGLLRFGLKWKEDDLQTFLRGHGLSISQASLSLHTTEFLVRWQIFSEERLLHLAPGLRPFVLQIDGTCVEGGPVTFRVREAKSGVTLYARQIVAESLDEVVPVLMALKIRFGDPGLIVRDDSATLKGACDRVFPSVPQQVDHFHFLSKAGERLVKEENEQLKEGLLADHGMAKLAEWSRDLPTVASRPEEWVAVVARLAAEWVDGTRSTGSSVPFHLPYYEAWEEMRWLVGEIGAIVHARVRARPWVELRPLVELKARLEKLLARPVVKEAGGRLASGVWAFEEVRQAMKVERDRRSHGDLGPMMEADVARVKATVARVGEVLRSKGDDRLGVLWGRVEEKFAEEEPYLWVVARVPGLTRSTVALERDHRECRTSIRHRTGQSDTGVEMGLLGTLLAYWSNVRNPWFIEQVLGGVNLREVFAKQDPEEVRRRMRELPRAGRRPSVPVSRKRRARALERALTILKGEGDLVGQLGEWARQELTLPTPAV
ncbi:MAG: hypothetical protein ACREB9_04010 [Thermoplasmata archaeon]